MLKLSDYYYELPRERIAQAPAVPRDSSRLLILNRKSGNIGHDVFRNIGAYLSEKDLLVANNTRVMPARIFGTKSSGGKVELLLLHEKKTNFWECLVRPGRRLPPGTVIRVRGSGVSARLESRGENGTRFVCFKGVDDVKAHLGELGEIPFPPYVTERNCDPEQYQTVYSKTEGSVAAPTAGLHFTGKLLDTLKSRGISFAEVTLHVGWGTFRPVRCDDVTEHRMEKEWYEISPETAEALPEAESSEKRIVAVGTTSCRVLEGLPAGKIQPTSEWTNLFIYPGFQFKRIGALITNFHLPKSTLLMLVSAFAGRDLILKAYHEAVEKGYRFYSFGDAMLIL